MKLQFSLAKLLICVTVLAVVCAFAVTLTVKEITFPSLPRNFSGEEINTFSLLSYSHPPTGWDITRRLAFWDTPAVTVTLAGLWIVRGLKSRREIEPPVG